MYRVVLSVLLLVALIVPATAEDLKTDAEKLGYAIGMNIGTNLKRQQIEADAEQLANGLKASFSGSETVLSTEEMQQILMAYQQKMQQEMMEKMAAEMANNQKYLEENAKKEGVVTTDSGLQYKVLTQGNGASPVADSNVQVHYRGSLIDGTEFDSSYARNEPVSFPLNGVITGWTEALQLMKEGDKWELTIPSQLAYGEMGKQPVIPPNATLVFEVELLKVLPKE